MTPDQPGSAPRLHVPLWLLALFTFSGTLAMHVFVPALPFVAAGLHASVGATQLTVSVYVAGLALGQLVYGPAADRWGRRPTLVFGTALFTAGSLAAAFAPDIGSLVAARLVQALGGCAGLLLGRTIVRDTSSDENAARRLALMNLLMVIGPGLAPLVGAALAPLLGWRAIFIGLAALGIVNLLCCWRLLPETLPASGPDRAGAREIARRYTALLRSPRFVGYAVGGGCATTSLYAYVAAAPFIFVHDLHRPAQEVGLYLGLLLLGAWVGNACATRLVRRMPLDRMLRGGQALSLAAAAALLAVVLLGATSVGWLVALTGVLTVGMGIASPGAMTQALSVDARVTGSASGLYGFSQMGVGAACSALVVLASDQALGAATVMLGAGLIAQLCFAVAVRSAPPAAAAGTAPAARRTTS